PHRWFPSPVICGAASSRGSMQAVQHDTDWVSRWCVVFWMPPEQHGVPDPSLSVCHSFNDRHLQLETRCGHGSASRVT
ncbi:MAG: hypothetical protein AAGD07_11680, partial [Planctomycetota bacterium]